MALENSIKYRLDESLFERMVYPCTHGVPPFPTSRLNIQRRMHPAIADLMRATLYPQLKVRLLMIPSFSAIQTQAQMAFD